MKHLHNIVLGVSYRTADASFRDQLCFKGEEKKTFQKSLLQQELVAEVAILSTCNRTEIYVATFCNDNKIKDIVEKMWATDRSVSLQDLRKVAFYYQHADAVKHLYRVVCSLDSMVVGEGQIFGQVKDAFFESVANKTVGPYLNQLFQSAFALGKLARSETTINQGAVSISYAAVELCKKVFTDISKAKVGIIGTGEMGYLAAQHLRQAGVVHFEFINRTVENALEFASEFNAKVRALADLDDYLPLYDIVISATGSPQIIVTKTMVEKALKKRRHDRMILVDIAAPRDLDPEIQNLSSAYLFGIDDLEEVVRENRDKRQEATHEVERLLQEKLDEYVCWYHSLKVVPTIRVLKEKLEHLANQELEKYSAKLSAEDEALFRSILHGIIGKWLHSPFEGLKQLSEGGVSPETLKMVHQLFDISEEEHPSEKN